MTTPSPFPEPQVPPGARHPQHPAAGADRVVREAAAAASVEKSGDVRGVPRQHSHHDLCVQALGGHGRSAGGLHPGGDGLAVVHRAVRQLRRSRGRRPQQGAGGRAARRQARHHGEEARCAAQGRKLVARHLGHAAQGRRVPGRGRRLHSRRRRGHRRRGLGGRVGHHRRVGAGHPRVRRRFLLGDRRHARASPTGWWCA